MKDYERIERIIRYLDTHRADQPDLETLASISGMNRFRLHRLFSTWAGVTPKDFLQALTLDHAKRLLRDGESVLDAALDSGLSGAGRLHDLCVTLEAMSPGEWKSGGAGWEITAGFTASPFGDCLIAVSPRGICDLSFADHVGRKAACAALHDAWPGAKIRRDDAAVSKIAGTIFRRPARGRTRPELRAFVRGTPFQVKVWRALLRIPPGALISYGRLASEVGASGAARAVGTAMGRNPIGFLIPCHRVIRETGAFGEYSGGALRKRAIIAWESMRR